MYATRLHFNLCKLLSTKNILCLRLKLSIQIHIFIRTHNCFASQLITPPTLKSGYTHEKLTHLCHGERKSKRKIGEKKNGKKKLPYAVHNMNKCFKVRKQSIRIIWLYGWINHRQYMPSYLRICNTLKWTLPFISFIAF